MKQKKIDTPIKEDTMAKDMAKKKETALATPFESHDVGGDTLDASDIQIPRLQLLQAMSDGVPTGDFKMGDILHTADQEVLGGIKTPLKIIPFHIVKLNQKFRTDVQPKEYITTEDWSVDTPWEEENYAWTQRDGATVNCKVNNFKVYICLLYTSPSPRDQRGSRMPSSA